MTKNGKIASKIDQKMTECDRKKTKNNWNIPKINQKWPKDRILTLSDQNLAGIWPENNQKLAVAKHSPERQRKVTGSDRRLRKIDWKFNKRTLKITLSWPKVSESYKNMTGRDHKFPVNDLKLTKKKWPRKTANDLNW